MKISLLCTLLSLSSFGAAGIVRRANTGSQTKSNSKSDSGVVKVRGGDVVVLQGNGGRNSDNEIVIVDNSNESRGSGKQNGSHKHNNDNDSGFANIIVIQGQNTYTMVNGQVSGQSDGSQTVTVTSTVTSTITSIQGQSTIYSSASNTTTLASYTLAAQTTAALSAGSTGSAVASPV